MASIENPDRFAPGRARLETSPEATGSETSVKTIGIAAVAVLAAGRTSGWLPGGDASRTARGARARDLDEHRGVGDYLAGDPAGALNNQGSQASTRYSSRDAPGPTCTSRKRAEERSTNRYQSRYSFI